MKYGQKILREVCTSMRVLSSGRNRGENPPNPKNTRARWQHRVTHRWAVKVPSIALLLLLSACSRYPTNDYECRIEASRAPTIRGVNEASDACDEKFKDEIAARKK